MVAYCCVGAHFPLLFALGSLLRERVEPLDFHALAWSVGKLMGEASVFFLLNPIFMPLASHAFPPHLLRTLKVRMS